MNKPFQIELGEWWYKGCFIQEQNHPELAKYVIWQDNEEQSRIDTATTMKDAKKICEDNEIKDYHLGIEAFGYKKPLPKNLKEFSYTHYYRGIELRLICVTTSLNKFADLLGFGYSIRPYSHSYEPRTKECIDNQDTIYAELGMGGEGMYVFNKDEVHLFTDYKTMIDKHRETYKDYRDYLDKTGNK